MPKALPRLDAHHGQEHGRLRAYISTGVASRYPQLADPSNVTIQEPLIGRVYDEPNWATFIAGAPNALLHVAQVLDPEDASASMWDVAKAMMRLDKSVQILNVSFSCFTQDGEVPLALRRAIDRLDPTTVVVAAAGNHGELLPTGRPGSPGPTAQMWPAAMDRVIAIGSHDHKGNLSTFSPKVPWVRLTALGTTSPAHTRTNGCGSNTAKDDGAELPKELDFTNVARLPGAAHRSPPLSSPDSSPHTPVRDRGPHRKRSTG